MYRRTPRYRGVNTAQSRLWAKKLLIKAPMIVLLIIFIHTYVQLIQAVVTFREWPSYRFGHNVGSTILAVYDAGLIMTNSFIILFDSETTPIKSSLPSINLKIDPGSLDKMLTNLPKSAKEKYYLGMLAYPDGSWQRVEYRLRGRSPYHWHKQKPSIRIKTQKSNPINLQRHINLINPEDRAMVSNVIGEDIATKLGVIAPQTVPARLFLNGDFKGVYHLSTHEDESWLRLRCRVPGPLFIGNWLKPIWDLKDFQIKGDLDVLDRFNPMQTMLDALVLPNGPE